MRRTHSWLPQLTTLFLALLTAMPCPAKKMSKYLFAYFTGNAPEQEQICYAVSDDGFNYTRVSGFSRLAEAV